MLGVTHAAPLALTTKPKRPTRPRRPIRLGGGPVPGYSRRRHRGAGGAGGLWHHGAKLTALKKKIDAFETSLAKPRQQVATSSAATVELAEKFTEADAVLNKCLDKLVYQFKDSVPDLFNEYQTARSIVNLRGGRKPTDAPTPTPTPILQPA